MSGPPPPPPPHGEAPRTTASGGGLPPGKYDIFIIPEHSAGGGFLYLPSLRTNTNSFVAGFASALVLVVLSQSMAPAFQAWWANFQGMGNMGMSMLVIAVGLGAWSLGRTQQDGGGGAGGHDPGASGPSGGHGNPGANFPGAGAGGPGPSQSAPPPNAGPPPNAHGHAPPPPPPQHDSPRPDKPKPSWSQRPPPQTGAAKPDTAKGTWEKAREETRKRQEEKKAKEEEQKRKDAAAQRLRELREKEAREREQREKERREREAREEEAREKERREQELREQREREQREKEQREKEQKARELRERLEREAKEREEKRRREEEEREREREREKEREKARKGSTYAYSGVGERINPWPNGKPPVTPSNASSPNPSPKPAPAPAQSQAPRAQVPPQPQPSPTKPPPAPTARTFVDEEEAYSYRPYDKPKKPRKKSFSDMSESSWAPSMSTARTTPPPSVRGAYSTKDPDKIVIRAVYCFMNQYAKTPASQLISGIGTVTDGLILRVTTEGLFIDDDVRGVAQREWDVKAWTLKLVEVWCPQQCLVTANKEAAASASVPGPSSNPHSFLHKAMRSRAAERGASKTLTGADADAHLAELLHSCKDACRLGLGPYPSALFDKTDVPNPATASSASSSRTDRSYQTGEWGARGLHLLRATIRDQEGKRYLFVLSEEEGWKVAVGLQRLRKGTQVRALGVSGMSGLEAKTTLELLGW